MTFFSAPYVLFLTSSSSPKKNWWKLTWNSFHRKKIWEVLIKIEGIKAISVLDSDSAPPPPSLCFSVNPLQKIALYQGFTLFSAIFNSHYTGDCTNWNCTNWRPPVLYFKAPVTTTTTLTRFCLFWPPTYPPALTFFYGINIDKKWTFLDHLPTSSCKRSL
jgi:hypothetical protein